jgi:D-3-phosphoglycerate dehydrogenase
MLLGHAQVINLPHIGASTVEAETNCAVMVANQIQDFLEQGTIVNSVNFPTAYLTRPEGYRLAIVNINAPTMVAQISQKIGQAGLNINEMLNKSHEKIAYTILDIDSAVDEKVLAQIASIAGVINVRVIERYQKHTI